MTTAMKTHCFMPLCGGMEIVVKKILVMTDIEGVSGVTTFPQAEKSEFGREMLMNDLCAVLEGIRRAGAEAVVYDMHTDGRNVDITRIDAPVVMELNSNFSEARPAVSMVISSIISSVFSSTFSFLATCIT